MSQGRKRPGDRLCRKAGNAREVDSVTGQETPGRWTVSQGRKRREIDCATDGRHITALLRRPKAQIIIRLCHRAGNAREVDSVTGQETPGRSTVPQGRKRPGGGLCRMAGNAASGNHNAVRPEGDIVRD